MCRNLDEMLGEKTYCGVASHPGGSSDTLSFFMLRNRDRLLLGEPLGSSADCIFVFKRLCHYNCYKHIQTVSEKHHHDDKIVSRIRTSWKFKRIKKCFLFTFNQGSTSSCTEEPPTLDLSKIPAQLLIPSEDLNLQDILGRVNCPNFSFLSMFFLLQFVLLFFTRVEEKVDLVFQKSLTITC